MKQNTQYSFNMLLKATAIGLLCTAVLPGFAKALSASQTHKQGELIKSGGTIFLINNSQRYGFASAGEFASWGYEFGQALPASAADMALPYAGAMKARPTTLVQDPSDRNYYVVLENGAASIGSDPLGVFMAGFENHIQYAFSVGNYPKLPDINFTYAYQGSNPGSLIYDKGTIYLVGHGQKMGIPSQAVLQSYGFSLNNVNVIRPPDKALKNGPVLTYREGSLINDGGTVYLISQGTKYPFTSLKSFRANGYQLKYVINGSTDGYGLGEPVQ